MSNKVKNLTKPKLKPLHTTTGKAALNSKLCSVPVFFPQLTLRVAGRACRIFFWFFQGNNLDIGFCQVQNKDFTINFRRELDNFRKGFGLLGLLGFLATHFFVFRTRTPKHFWVIIDKVHIEEAEATCNYKKKDRQASSQV